MSLIVKGPTPNDDDARLIAEVSEMRLLDGEEALVSSVAKWFEARGFLTDRQREALEEIYARAEARG